MIARLKMMAIRCAAIVHAGQGVLLTHEKIRGQSKWRLPECGLADNEDPLRCIRRCVLLKTGYRPHELYLLKIVYEPRAVGRPDRTLRFVFGCRVGAQPLEGPTVETEMFTPEAILNLALSGQFEDSVLLRLVSNYKEGLAMPQSTVF